MFNEMKKFRILINILFPKCTPYKLYKAPKDIFCVTYLKEQHACLSSIWKDLNCRLRFNGPKHIAR